MTERQFVRHPTDVPIEFCCDLSGGAACEADCLNDVSLGGLSFQSETALETGAILEVRIPLTNPVFQIRGRVVWCRENSGSFDVGVEFLEAHRTFQARMVEQICHIEHYRIEMLEKEGRELTGEQAAIEWIGKYAADFPGA